MGYYVKAIIKLMIMVMLVVVVVAGAFGAGYASRAGQSPTLAPSAATLVEPQSPQITFTDEDAPEDFAVFWEAWAFVEEEFYGEVPSGEDRVYGAIRGMVNAYGDENTAFIDPERAAIFREDVSGSFEGIGATVRMDELGRLVIAEPFVGRPAAEAGLLRGDIVLSVDDESLQGLSLYESIGLIRGPAGTTVVLTVFRDGVDEPFDVPIERARIEIEVVESERLEGDIGYIRLSEFSRGATGKMAEAFKDLNGEAPLKGPGRVDLRHQSIHRRGCYHRRETERRRRASLRGSARRSCDRGAPGGVGQSGKRQCVRDRGRGHSGERPRHSGGRTNLWKGDGANPSRPQQWL
jgi:carboxyl-terminal processing protease